jgi:hypothetical protein
MTAETIQHALVHDLPRLLLLVFYVLNVGVVSLYSIVDYTVALWRARTRA